MLSISNSLSVDSQMKPVEKVDSVPSLPLKNMSSLSSKGKD